MVIGDSWNASCGVRADGVGVAIRNWFAVCIQEVTGNFERDVVAIRTSREGGTAVSNDVSEAVVRHARLSVGRDKSPTNDNTLVNISQG